MKKTILLLLISFVFNSYIKAQNWEALGDVSFGVYCLYHDSTDNSLYIGGAFLWFDSLQANGLVKWDGQSFSTIGNFPNQTYGIPPSSSYPVSSIIKYQGDLYCTMRKGGWDPGEVRGLAKWDGVKWDSVAGIDGHVFEQIIFNDELYIMGRFLEQNDSIRSIINWDGENYYDTGFQNWLGQEEFTILAAEIFEGELYVGGNFWNENETISDVAKFDGTNWHPVADGIKGGFDDVGDLIIYKNELYVCGDFKKSSGNAGNLIMKLKNNTWVDVGGSFDYGSGTALKMLVYMDRLYVFGNFDNKAGGVPVQRIAIWDGEKWCGLGDDFNNAIGTGALYNNELIIGGGWEYINDIEISNLARWIGGDYVDTCGAIVSAIEPEIAEKIFELFPNPASHELHISITGDFLNQPISLTIFNIIGERLFEQRSFDPGEAVDVSGLASGTYILQLQSGEGVLAQKFVVQR